jgi:hypothetical protein
VAATDQDQAVDAALDQRAHLLRLLIWIVLGVGHEQGVTRFVQPCLKGGDAGGEDRDIERRHHRTDGPRLPRGEHPRRAVGYVVQFLYGGPDPLPERGADLLRRIYDARHRRRGHPRDLGYVRQFRLRQLHLRYPLLPSPAAAQVYNSFPRGCQMPGRSKLGAG